MERYEVPGPPCHSDYYWTQLMKSAFVLLPLGLNKTIRTTDSLSGCYKSSSTNNSKLGDSEWPVADLSISLPFVQDAYR